MGFALAAARRFSGPSVCVRQWPVFILTGRPMAAKLGARPPASAAELVSAQSGVSPLIGGAARQWWGGLAGPVVDRSGGPTA